MDDSIDGTPVLGDLPELPDHVWTAALNHAFDPWAEPEATLVPATDLTGPNPDDLDLPVDHTDADTDGLFDSPYDDTAGYDPGDHDLPDSTDPGLTDTDGYY